MNIDNLKDKWRQAPPPVYSNDGERPTTPLGSERPPSIRSSRNKLARRYLVLTIFSATLLVCSPLTYTSLGYPALLTLWLIMFLDMTTIFNFVLYNHIRSLNVSRLTVIEMIRHMKTMTAMRRRFRIISLATGIPFIAILLVYFLDHNATATLMGGFIGGTIGALIGVTKELSLRRVLTDIEDQLDDLSQQQ